MKDYTMKDIAEMYGLTVSGVCRKLASAGIGPLRVDKRGSREYKYYGDETLRALESFGWTRRSEFPEVQTASPAPRNIDFSYPRDIDTVVHADCYDIFPHMPSASAELILTDIPYGAVSRPSAGIRKYDKGAADDAAELDIPVLLDHLARIAKGSIYVFCSTEQVSEIRSGFVERGLTTRLCIWSKTNPSPVNGQHLWLSGIETCVYARKKGAVYNEHCKSPVWSYPNGRSKHHPTEKPLSLMKYLVRTSSNPGDIVFDPFVGSGTTAVAAITQGRSFLAVEKCAEFHALATRRVEETRAAATNEKCG